MGNKCGRKRNTFITRACCLKRPGQHKSVSQGTEVKLSFEKGELTTVDDKKFYHPSEAIQYLTDHCRTLMALEEIYMLGIRSLV